MPPQLQVGCPGTGERDVAGLLKHTGSPSCRGAQLMAGLHMARSHLGKSPGWLVRAGEAQGWMLREEVLGRQGVWSCHVPTSAGSTVQRHRATHGPDLAGGRWPSSAGTQARPEQSRRREGPSTGRQHSPSVLPISLPAGRTPEATPTSNPAGNQPL